MGTRLEIYTDAETADELISISKSFQIAAQVIGRVESSDSSSVEVHHKGQVYNY